MKQPERIADHSLQPSVLSRLPLYDFVKYIEKKNILCYEVDSFRLTNSGIQALKSRVNIPSSGQRHRIRSDPVSFFAQQLNDLLFQIVIFSARFSSETTERIWTDLDLGGLESM